MIGFGPNFYGCWTPSKLFFLWLINRGDPNYLLNRMILQVSESSRKDIPYKVGPKPSRYEWSDMRFRPPKNGRKNKRVSLV